MGEVKPILTQSELKAKRFIIKMIVKGSFEPLVNATKNSESLPHWYDRESFKRGQKFYHNNRLGVLYSHVIGLFVLMGDPRGAEVLYSTGKSSTAETARGRYISTIMHMLSWYEVDLSPDSNSRDSLSKVRKMHLHASKVGEKEKMGIITQEEMALSTIGLIGFALVRSQYLGIRCNNKADREGFIHFWAVIGYMLGVADEYNVCLFDIETIENICLIVLRYIFIPMVQLETPKFNELANVLVDGLSPFLPFMSYANQMFLVKRIVGVPGYQYRVDVQRERICGSIFTTDELSMVKQVFSTMYKDKNDLMELYGILFNDGVPVVTSKSINSKSEQNKDLHCHEWIEIGNEKINWIMTSNEKVDWKEYLNDAQFSVLGKWDQFVVLWYCLIFKYYDTSIGRYFCEKGFNVVLFYVRRFHNRNIARKAK